VGRLKIIPKAKLTVFENTVLRRIFGPEINEMSGGLREPTHDEVHQVKLE
jgi:hypothetical protein